MNGAMFNECKKPLRAVREVCFEQERKGWGYFSAALVYQRVISRKTKRN